MPTHQDFHIWMTGVVGRAMGSGNYGPEQIPLLAKYAQETFLQVFGPVDEQKAAPVMGYPSQPQRQPSGVGQEPIAEGKPFRVWSGDKIRLGKKPGPGGKPWGEVTWAEAHRAVSSGSAQARGYLSFLANLEDKDPQYAKSNQTMRMRAQAVLDSVPERERDEQPI